MSRDKPLNHPRDLFTPEQQAQMDRELRNMNAARDVPLGRGEEIRLVYVNADAECDEALRTIEVAYAELLERYQVLAARGINQPSKHYADMKMWLEYAHEYFSESGRVGIIGEHLIDDLFQANAMTRPHGSEVDPGFGGSWEEGGTSNE